MSSFTNKKQLRFVITLGVGTFGSSQDNVITLEGFRAYVDIERAGGAMAATLQAKIYGVSISHMNSITTLLYQPRNEYWQPNTITVYAIDGDSETMVFTGNIIQAWGEFRGMPDVYLHIQSQAMYFDKLKAVPPRSFQGQIDIATAISQIANDLGLTFENNGVSAQAENIYVANTAIEQVQELARMAGCELYIDNTTLAITPKGTPRSSQTVPIISKDTGLVGYPTFDGNGIIFKMLFDPGVKWGANIQMQSDLTQANGTWKVLSISYRLESERPRGEWFAIVRCSNFAL